MMVDLNIQKSLWSHRFTQNNHYFIRIPLFHYFLCVACQLRSTSFDLLGPNIFAREQLLKPSSPSITKQFDDETFLAKRFVQINYTFVLLLV